MRSNKHSNLDGQKKKYIFLLGLVFIGLIFGIVFSLLISKSDKLVVDNTINSFFESIGNQKINYLVGLRSSLLSNILYLSIVWFLGMSVIGMPIVIFLLFIRGFILGFSIGSIVRLYSFKGILGAFFYIFPHHIIYIIISVLLTFYAITFSLKLFKYLFLHKDINFQLLMKRYFKILIICLIAFILCSFIEVYVSPILINLFNFLI